MATLVHIKDLFQFVCIGLLLLDICSGQAIWSFNGTTEQILPTENNILEVHLTQQLVYQGRKYSQLYISKDGLVGFNNGIQYKAVDFSGPNVAVFIDRPFIAPYHYDGQGLDSLQFYTGHVYYHQFNTTSDMQSRTYPSLTYLGQYLRSQIIGSDTFVPTWGLQVTWTNVTSAQIIRQGPCQGTTDSPCRTNTFQLVLLSDGADSYAIFNYGDMQINPDTYDQAGFNGGYGTGWFGVFKSGLKTGKLLNRLQGSDTVGRYVFKISSPNIVRGGCTSDLSNTDLSVYPTFAGMLGGKMVDVSGPCFNPRTFVQCRFGEDTNAVTDGIYVSKTRIRCMVPRLTVRGRVKLSLSTGGSSYSYSAPFTIVFPSQVPMSEQIIPQEAWYNFASGPLTIKWDPALLTNQSSSMVDIKLYGYRETTDQLIYTKLEDIASVSVGTGQYSFPSDSFQCSGENCFDYEIGLFEVRLRDPSMATRYGFISGRMTTLGWYVRQAMESRHGNNWQSALCGNWYDRDKQNTAWVQTLLSCPCSLDQAIADFGRWAPDDGCSFKKAQGQFNCYFHGGAKHCVRAIEPVDGAGNQCCYNQQGTLMFSNDNVNGSTPDRSHTWGAIPYGQPDYVPSMSHWIHDVVSFYYCCLWDNYRSCDRYMDLRPTRDCTGYTPPMPGSIYGQGHVRTFTGAPYRILGPGDYVLATAGNTIIQGRFERNPLPVESITGNYTIKTTFALTAVAIMDRGTSDKVEIRLRIPPADRLRQRLDVRVNGEAIVFDDGPMAWQDFKGVSVVNTDIKEHIQSNFTVIMTNGIGLQVVELIKSNVLQLDLMMPADKFINVSGLFGDANGNLMTANGSAIDLNVLSMASSNSRMYNTFQLTWAVNETESLFVDYLPANHTILGPLDLNPDSIASIGAARSNCGAGNDQQCIFDYMYTGSKLIASATQLASKRYALLSTYLQPVRSCGLLNVPRATKSNYDYVLGTTTSITGCREGSLSGETTYTCVETSNITQAWSPSVSATCKIKTDKADVGMIVGIVIAVVAVIVIAVVIVVFVMKRRNKGHLIDDRRDIRMPWDPPNKQGIRSRLKIQRRRAYK